MTIPGPGVGEFFLGGFQNGEDAVEGFGAGELVAESCAGGEGFEEAFELAHAHWEVCHGVMQLVVVLENDEGITLAASDQNWMALPSDFISVPVYSSELDASPI